MSLLTRKVVLASGSEFRARILKDAGVEFEVIVSDVDETLDDVTDAAEFAKTLATRKAVAVAKDLEDAIVIGSDTICSVAGEITGKPKDETDAHRMIAKSCETGLQQVITGVCVIDTRDNRRYVFHENSLVQMKPATETEISAYVKSGEPMGKCGALCIESGQNFVESWRGSFDNVMGLPIERLLPVLLKLDVN
ncbi:Maf family protein [Planctomycetota bacterium]|nr:Maf family protein [Planctomycetota bacterium]